VHLLTMPTSVPMPRTWLSINFFRSDISASISASVAAEEDPSTGFRLALDSNRRISFYQID
jgi:hypothetical protein